MAQHGTLSGHCRELLSEIARVPARSLTAFMDEVDEVWMVDAFMDLPESADGRA